MPKYTFDFALEAWIRYLEIEADSYEDAVKQLNDLSLDDIASKGYCQDSNITDIDCESDDDDYTDDEDNEDDENNYLEYDKED